MLLITNRLELIWKENAKFKWNLIPGGRGHLTVNYTGTQSFIETLSYSLTQKRWVLSFDFYRLAPNSNVQTFLKNSFKI